jgi:phosphopantothenoylcysteine decarboxylase/phosphopantothenate--cysteine ligase
LVEADLLVIAPLSANTLAKLAHGLADNVLTQLALAFRGPVLCAPAMNVRMWEHPATQANVAILRERGVDLVGPEAGELAEGEIGLGRMREPETIFARCRELLGETDALAGDRARHGRWHASRSTRSAYREPLVRADGRALAESALR